MAKSPRRSKALGNTLTLLLSCIMLMSLSLSLASLTLGPAWQQKTLNSSYAVTVREVAKKHLDYIQEYIEDHPEEFRDDRIWDPINNASHDGRPPRQLLNSTHHKNHYPQTTWYTTGSKMLVYTDSVQLPGESSSKSVISTVDNDGFIYAISRYAPPHHNTLEVEVSAATTGSKTSIHERRVITLKPVGFCDLAHAKLPPQQISTLPSLSPAETLLYGPENNNFKIGKISGPFFQLGEDRVCIMPNLTNATETVSCEYTGSNPGLGGAQPVLLRGMQAIINAPNMNNGYSTFAGRFVAYRTSNIINLRYNSNYPFVLTERNRNSNPIPNLDVDSIDVSVYGPIALTIDNSTRALIVYKQGAGANNLKMTWARWDNNVIYPEGLFDATGPQTIDVFPGIEVQTFSTSDIRKNHRHFNIFATDINNKQVLFREFNYRTNPAGWPVDVSAAPFTVTSTPYSPNSPSRVMQNIVEFGKPINHGGKMAVVPVLYDDGLGNPYSRHVKVLAFDTSGGFINDTNQSYNFLALPGLYSNIAPLQSFNQPRNNAGIIGVNTDNWLDNLDDIYVGLNADTFTFYWITRNNNDANTLLHEWDPITWGVGPTDGSSADYWPERGNNQAYLYNNIKVIGRKQAVSGFGGTYRTVKSHFGMHSHGSGTLWDAGEPQPRLVIDKRKRINGSSLQHTEQAHQYFALTSGQVQVVSSNNTETIYPYGSALETAHPDGRAIAIDPDTGWLYFSTRNNEINKRGLRAFHPSGNYTLIGGMFGTPNMQPVPFQLANADFTNAPTQGDGNLLYSPYTRTLYFLDIIPGSRPIFFAVRHRCPTYKKTVSAMVPGFNGNANPGVTYDSANYNSN